MKLLVMPLMVRVFSRIHRVIRLVRMLATKVKISTMSYFQMTLVAKQNAVAEGIRATILYWLSMVRLPTPALAFGAITPNKFFPAGTTGSALPVPSLFYSVAGKGHRSTSRSVANGWVDNGKNTRVLFRDGKPTGIYIMILSSLYQGKSKRIAYDIYQGSKYIGYAWSLTAAKRRAEAHFKKARR